MQNLGISFGPELNHVTTRENMTEYKKSDASKLVSTDHMVGNFLPEFDGVSKLSGVNIPWGQRCTLEMMHIFQKFSENFLQFQDFQKCTIQQLVFAHYNEFEMTNQHDNNSQTHTFSAKIEPRKGADGSLVDLPTGLGKTITTSLGALLYVLLDFENLKKNYKLRCCMQTHSNITEYNESTVYRNIITICCPLHLVQNWENAVDQIISCLGVFLKEKYNKYLKRYTFANINNIQEDLGKDDEIAFVIYKPPQTGVSVTLTLKPGSCENAPIVHGKNYISHPVFINDESHEHGSQFNRKLCNPKFSPHAAHYIAVTATPNVDFTGQFSINEYILNPFNYSRYSKSDLMMKMNIYFACRTDHNLVKSCLENVYGRIKIHEITMKTVKSSYGGGSELDQFQSRENNFVSFQNHARKSNIQIPNEWIQGFTFEALKDLITNQIVDLESTFNLRGESSELTRKRNAMKGFLEKMTGEEEETCPICLEEIEFSRDNNSTDEESKKRKHDETLPDVIFTTCCRQRFHKECYQKCINLMMNNCCPMCKQSNNAMVDIHTKPLETEVHVEQEVFEEPSLLKDWSMATFSEFLNTGWYEKKSLLPHSMYARLEQLVSSLLHYKKSFPLNSLQLLLISDTQNMNSFKEVLHNMIPVDQADFFEIREHKNKGDRYNRMTVKKSKMNLQSFINNVNQGIISILFCEDRNSNDSLVGLDLGTIDGILCFGEVDEKKKSQRIGRITRFSRAVSTYKNECIYVQLG